MNLYSLQISTIINNIMMDVFDHAPSSCHMCELFYRKWGGLLGYLICASIISPDCFPRWPSSTPNLQQLSEVCFSPHPHQHLVLTFYLFSNTVLWCYFAFFQLLVILGLSMWLLAVWASHIINLFIFFYRTILYFFYWFARVLWIF